MARLASRLSVAALALAVGYGTGSAQSLARLHVRAFSLSADRDIVRVGETFRIKVTLRVDEQLDSCDNVALPDLYGFTVLGDERAVNASPAGTTCSETVTLSAAEPGNRHIGPVTLEAIDANTNRASRFGSNTIVVRVESALPGANALGTLLSALFWILIVLLGLLLFLRVRRPRLGPVTRLSGVSDVPATTAAIASEGSRWRSLIATLSEHPTRENVVAVRTLLRQRAGAREDETFGDILARESRAEPALLEAMRAVERAAFIDDVHLYGAVRDAIAALERYAGTIAA